MQADRLAQGIQLSVVERPTWLLGVRADLRRRDGDQSSLRGFSTVRRVEEGLEPTAESLPAKAPGRSGVVAHLTGRLAAPTGSRRSR